MRQIAAWITRALDHRGDAAELKKIRNAVTGLTEQYPLYDYLRPVPALA
jgi:glycine/serine hydroxymethyltransferase